jgi:hypothetical protein
MSLKDVVTKSNNSSDTSSKGPKYYNDQKNAFIKAMAESENAATRLEVAQSPYTPAKILAEMMRSETEEDILRALALNERTSLKAIEDFTETDLGDIFDDDDEVIEAIRARRSKE